MPKNKGKGGKNRRRGKNESAGLKRELVFKEAGQEYGYVARMLGNGRLEAQCFDGVKRLCHIRGKMRKKVWVNAGDIILVSLRDFQDAKGDVILKYSPEEARELKTRKEIPENAKINEDDGGEEYGDVDFRDDSDDSSSDSEDDTENAPKAAKEEEEDEVQGATSSAAVPQRSYHAKDKPAGGVDYSKDGGFDLEAI